MLLVASFDSTQGSLVRFLGEIQNQKLSTFFYNKKNRNWRAKKASIRIA